MSFDSIRKCLDEDFGGLELLDIIPSHDSLVWIPFSGGIAPAALVIGQVQGRDVLAYVAQMGDKPIEARYCSKAVGDADNYTWKSIPQDDIMLMKLNAPFKYNADPSKASKRKFSIIIKWYFMVRGLVTDRVAGDIHDYCKRLNLALERIVDGQSADGNRYLSSLPRPRTAQDKTGTPDTIEESPEPVRNVYALRSTQPAVNENSEGGATQPPEPHRGALPSSDNSLSFTYQELCDYLASTNCSHFLKNIHEVDELQFFQQDVQPSAQPRKLFLGRTKDLHGEVYAYMLSTNGKPSIELWKEESDNGPYRSRLRMDKISQETLNHPFNKTFLPSSIMLSEGEQSRLKALITWYFIAADIACVSRKVMSHYPKLLRTTLAYIADRMGPAAAHPSTPAPMLPPSHTPTLHTTSSRISLPSPQPAATPNPSLSPHRRGSKRTAEDAVFEDIHRNIAKDVALTREINVVDEELVMLETKKEKWLAEWEREWDEVVSRRERVQGEREGVRKRFKRLSMGVVREEGG
jgi:hypothetical protein